VTCQRNSRPDRASVAHSALISVVTLTACSGLPTSTTIRREGLPADVALPTLSGTPNHYSQTLCDWVPSNYRPFPEMDSLHVTRLSQPSDARELIWGYLDSQRLQQLVLPLNPETVALTPIAEAVDHTALWQLTKVSVEQCQSHTDTAFVAVRRDANLCVHVRPAEHTDTDATAEYATSAIEVRTLGALPQFVAIDVLSIVRGSAVIGRTMRVAFVAHRTDALRVDRVCGTSPKGMLDGWSGPEAP